MPRQTKIERLAQAAIDSCSTDIGRYAVQLCIDNMARIGPDTTPDRTDKINLTAKSWMTSALKAEAQGDSKEIQRLAEAMAKLQSGDDSLDDVH